MFAVLIGALAGLAALAATRRWMAVRAQRRGLSDEHIRDIERHGSLEMDEPLDLEEAREEERRFWNEEAWDETEEP